MPSAFSQTVQELRTVAGRFDAASRTRQVVLLEAVSGLRWPRGRGLVDYGNVLMFMSAHPADPEMLSRVTRSLAAFAQYLRRLPLRSRRALENSGLPHTPVLSTYSHDLLAWMLASRHYRVQFDSFWHPAIPLSRALGFTLPPIERDLADGAAEGRRLLQALVPDPRRRLSFLVDEFSRLDDRPALKDYLFDGLHLYLRLQPTDRSFSRAFNRLPVARPFFHTDLIRRVDPKRWLKRRLPPPSQLAAAAREAVITTARHAMMLLERETDPTTHVDPASLRVYELERGLAVAIYGMVPLRQLPLESYVGYTLFKNGYPAAYGGSWVFGRRALFGINIFEPFRGGESALLLCQLLRVYHQTFGVDYFEAEPYQYGQGNPEGIRSGAFWFYYRHGFRPVEPELAALAASEHARILATPGYRTAAATLRRLAEGNIALRLGAKPHASVAEVRAAVTEHIQRQHGGNRMLAEAAARKAFPRTKPARRVGSAIEAVVRTELALWAAAGNLRSPRARALLRQMAEHKPVDVYGYQARLSRLLDLRRG